MSADAAAGDPPELTHLDAEGRARMVDVSGKSRTARTATATCDVLCSAATLSVVARGEVPKGDVFAVARIAGIAGAKRTPDLVRCAPVALTGVEVDVRAGADRLVVTAVVARAQDRTGVEMEALTAAAAAALACYDMLKAVERGIEITGLRLLTKEGGRSGRWERGSGERADGHGGGAPVTAMRAAVLTVSDRSSRGEREDTAGPRVAELLRGWGLDVDATEIVPDERGVIAAALRNLVRGRALVVTTGGPGSGRGTSRPRRPET